MIKILKLNLKDVLTSRVYLTQLILSLMIFTFITFSMLNTSIVETPQMLRFVVQYMLVLTNISMYFMLFSITINNLSVVEKCARLEYYLANGVPLNHALYSYSISSFLTSLINVVLFNVIIASFYLFKANLVIYDRSFVILLIIMCIFFFSISLFTNLFVLLIKNTNVIYTFIFILSFIFLFGGSFSLQKIAKINIGLSLNNLLSIILLCLSLIIFIVCFCLKKLLNNEKIILSIKE